MSTLINNPTNIFGQKSNPNSATFAHHMLQASRKRAGNALRTIVAVVLFALAGFASVGSSLDFAYAKKAARRVTSKVRQVKSKGQFRLLDIYNNLKATNAAFVDSMNHATKGLASWYGGMFHGRLTAMGTRYNMNEMTAAHRTLPLGTWVKVTNSENGESAIVQVTDRGPYVANRIMDLSSAAAIKLGYKNHGTTHIDMQVLGTDYASAQDAARAAGMLASADPSTATIDSTRVVAAANLAIPAVFVGISTRTRNIPVSADLETASTNGLIQTISQLATGSPAYAVANMFV